MHIAEAKTLADPGLRKLAKTGASIEVVLVPTGIWYIEVCQPVAIGLMRGQKQIPGK